MEVEEKREGSVRLSDRDEERHSSHTFDCQRKRKETFSPLDN